MLTSTQVFLIDNAGSLRNYARTNEVADVFATLFGLLRPYDNNGIDVYFTMSSGKHNFKDVKEAVDLVSRKVRSAAGISNFSVRLSEILEDYCNRLHKNTSTRRVPFVGLFAKPKKPMTIFVLTDGIWGTDSEVYAAQAISNTVRKLGELGKHPSQVGIEFIQFGDNEEAKKKLDELDSGLGLAA